MMDTRKLACTLKDVHTERERDLIKDFKEFLICAVNAS